MAVYQRKRLCCRRTLECHRRRSRVKMMSGPKLVKLAVFEVAELLLLHMSSASRVDPQTGVENSNGRKSREKPRSSRRHSQIPYDLTDTSSFIRRDCTVNQPGIYVFRFADSHHADSQVRPGAPDFRRSDGSHPRRRRNSRRRRGGGRLIVDCYTPAIASCAPTKPHHPSRS